MKVSCLKWNLFRFGSRTQTAYLKNQHTAFFTVKDLVSRSTATVIPCLSFQYAGIKTVSENRWDLLQSLSFSATADIINNLTGAGTVVCWSVPCFCCDSGAWRQSTFKVFNRIPTALETSCIKLLSPSNCFVKVIVLEILISHVKKVEKPYICSFMD